MNKTLPIMIIPLMAVLAGCGAQPTDVKQDYQIITNADGLTKTEENNGSILLIREGAPALNEYNRFIIDPVQIIYSDPNMDDLSPKQVARMQQYLQDAVITQLRDGGYQVGTKSAPSTMRITFKISGLKAPSAAANITSALAPFAISVGEVTIESVFTEASSNRIDAISVMSSKGSRFMNATPWSTWADVESTFDQWAKSFRESLDKAHQE
ncbi:DUF3313 family protein [Photobacterium rosenbergii]|uniref:DUF3313 family protein n=1 Tax=Photobacterium rosenbergii TaxID=294936 RepID=A0ABU3ZHS2_9GAMM|nr:DUF3313 family protein [Photobacterium rosenbergii]MDV5169607.1 DUF3313 family protein [Photobacterium rosenbergii]